MTLSGGYAFANIENTDVNATGWRVNGFEANDTGLTTGGGVGAQYLFNEKIFLSAEYELLWMSNSFYNDGLLNTASLGIGVKF